MNPRIKDLIGVAAILGVAFFAYATWVYVYSYAKSVGPGAYRTFSVLAEGEAVAIPDVAQFTLSVITQGGTDIASLQQQNVERVNSAIAFVKGQGVEDKDIKTQQFLLEPRYQHFTCPRPALGDAKPCPPPEIVGYTITQTVQVKVRDFAKVGEIVSGVVNSGANSVSQLAFTLDDKDAPQQEARNQAIQKAQKKADAMARAAGFRLGNLISLHEESGPPFFSLEERAFESGRGGAALPALPAPVIEPGSQEVKVSVTLTYEIR